MFYHHLAVVDFLLLASKRGQHSDFNDRVSPEKLWRDSSSSSRQSLEAHQHHHLCAQSCPALWLCGLWPARLLCPWDSPGKNTGVGCHFLLQGDPPNLGIKPVSLVCPALAGGFFTTGATWEAPNNTVFINRHYIIIINNHIIIFTIITIFASIKHKRDEKWKQSNTECFMFKFTPYTRPGPTSNTNSNNHFH